MSKVNVDDIAWTVWQSPKGKFSSSFKEISAALGAAPNAPVGAGGHPFDLCMEKLAPGEVSCPFHSHAGQWELFYILSGTGSVRLAAGSQPIRTGDAIMHEPGEVHQIKNTGKENLLYFIIADNPSLDFCYYPDSEKYSVTKSKFKPFLRVADVEYWDGEE